MQDLLIFSIVIVALAYILRKTFKKNGGCGCGEEGCSKK
ncbi:FeoB-associated Cys-rich membrane protein [Arcobacter sp.]